jgi:enoyl-CoA hydratase/carnithine racemase
MASEYLEFTINEGIARIVLNRPDKMNALTTDMIEGCAELLRECRRDDAVKVVIVTGNGKAFCSGGDILDMNNRLQDTPPERKMEIAETIQRIPLALEDLDKPVLAAVNGVATGAGMDIALMCDLRYAGRSARFAETYVRAGLVPGAGGTHFLPRIVGPSKALELFFLGDFIDADEAARIGIVTKVFDDDNLQVEVANIAARLARAPAMALRTMKRAIYQGMRNDLRTSLDFISSQFAIVASTDEHKAAVARFAQSRKL